MAAGRQGPFDAFDAAVAAEYITVSNSGAYSSSTLCGANTRRYHGLLAAPLDDPKGVFVLLASLEEILDVGGARYYLSTNEYPGAIFPEGYKHLKSFDMTPLPTLVFEAQGVQLTKRICLAPNESTAVVAYEFEGSRSDVTLEVRPLCAFRERHNLTEANVAAELSPAVQGDWVVFRPYGALPALRMKFDGSFRAAPDWYRRFEYRSDRERGYVGNDDLSSPGVFRGRLDPGRTVYFVATIEANTPAPHAVVEAAEAMAAEWAKPAKRYPDLAKCLSCGMRDFVVHRGNGVGILRGLPWYGEWARNAFLALPGLLALDRFAEAQGVLSTWAKRARGGLLPGFVDDHGILGEPDVEGSLWLFEAVEQFLAYTKNHEWVKANVWDFMNDCMEAISHGLNPAAQVGDDGLLYSMGAGRAIAPREGQAAFTEVQALYFNALKVMEFISGHFRDDASSRRWHEAAKAAQKAFNKYLWDARNHVPIDSYSQGNVDVTTRPMCLWSVALSHPVLIRRRWELVVQEIESALLTPRGMLAVPQDFPGARKFFPGESYEAARAGGGIWPEFLGAFLVAYAKAFGKSALGNEKIEDYIKRLCDSLASGLLHHVSEFFDSVEPFTPRGAPANAAASGQLIWALTTKVNPRHYGGEEGA